MKVHQLAGLLAAIPPDTEVRVQDPTTIDGAIVKASAVFQMDEQGAPELLVVTDSQVQQLMRNIRHENEL